MPFAPILALGAMLAAPVIVTVDAGKAFDSADAFGRETPAGWRAGNRIAPVWERQNVWMPWARWKPGVPSTLPVFDPFVREIAVVMAAGYRPDTDWVDGRLTDISIPDLYSDSAGIPRPFDRGHPLFSLLKLLRSRGIRPVLDLGPVPRAFCRDPRPGPFRWNVSGPVDGPRYQAYVKALFLFLTGPGGFPREDVETWRFQMWREPDNSDSWDPDGKGTSLDSANLKAFLEVYDRTLTGMRQAGIRAPLGFGNLMVAWPGVWIFKDSWLDALTRHLADPSALPGSGASPRPRIASPADTLLFSFTAYGGNHTQLEWNPRALDSLARRFRAEIRKRVPRNPLEITVGEGNLFSDQLHHRSDGTELGAAWTAALYKASVDAGVDRYQHWGFVSAPHASRFDEAGGLQSGPYNVVQLYRELAKGKRRTVRLEPADPAPAPADIDALATRADDGTLRILAFHYRPERGSRASPKGRLRLTGLRPGATYVARRRRIDRDRGQYLTKWNADLAAAGLKLAVPFDACMEYQFTPEQWALWKKRRPAYAALTRLTDLASRPDDTLRADAQGRAETGLELPANSVTLVEIARAK